jgi:hypothetical protein
LGGGELGGLEAPRGFLGDAISFFDTALFGEHLNFVQTPVGLADKQIRLLLSWRHSDHDVFDEYLDGVERAARER